MDALRRRRQALAWSQNRLTVELEAHVEQLRDLPEGSLILHVHARPLRLDACPLSLDLRSRLQLSVLRVCMVVGPVIGGQQAALRSCGSAAHLGSAATSHTT